MLYIQSCLVGLSILIIPLLKRQRGYGREWELFRSIILTVMIDLVLETTGWLLDGRMFNGANELIYAVNFVTILLQPVMGLLWLYYAMGELHISIPKKSPLHVICALPFIINALLLFTNHWTNFVYTVGVDNTYARGELFWLGTIFSFAYPAAATVIALISAAKAKSSTQKQDCYVLASFILPPVIAATMQIIWYGAFLFLIGFSISLLIIFINIQNEQITVDFLTRINNRTSLIAYYERRVHSIKRDNRLYLFMIDVDSFKRVNDTYGHVVGDQVLIAVAENLKTVCAGKRCLLARLGGDEFGVLFECEQPNEAADFALSINNCLNDFNSDSNLSSPVTLSVGYAACDGPSCSIDHLIQQADAMMYTKKAKRHLMDATKRHRESAMYWSSEMR